MGKAYELKRYSNDDGTLIQVTYRLDPPVPFPDWDYEKDECGEKDVEFIVISQSHLPSLIKSQRRGETFVFVGTPDGEITDWMELSWSRRGDDISHESILRENGYEPVHPNQ